MAKPLTLDDDISSLLAAIISGHNIVLHAPIMLQSAIALGNYCCKVNIGIDTLLRGYKSVTSLIIEPLNLPLHNANE